MEMFGLSSPIYIRAITQYGDNLKYNINLGKKQIKFQISSDKTPSHVKQISKPGQRIYAKCKDIPRPLRGLALVVISTPKGVTSGKDASKAGLGGELICEIW
jgi:small subunit ribosomal protein S8